MTDVACQDWGEFDLANVTWLHNTTPGKRSNPHLKRFLAEDAVQAKRGKTLQNAMAGAGLQWERQRAKQLQTESMRAFVAGCYQNFDGCPSVACITDGFRIGKPAKELTVTAVENLGTAADALLPPVEILIKNKHIHTLHMCMPDVLACPLK